MNSDQLVMWTIFICDVPVKCVTGHNKCLMEINNTGYVGKTAFTSMITLFG